MPRCREGDPAPRRDWQGPGSARGPQPLKIGEEQDVEDKSQQIICGNFFFV